MEEEPTETGEKLTAAEILSVKIQDDIRVHIETGVNKTPIREDIVREEDPEKFVRDMLKLGANPFDVYSSQRLPNIDLYIYEGVPQHLPPGTEVLVTSAIDLFVDDPQKVLEEACTGINGGFDQLASDAIDAQINSAHPDTTSGLVSIPLGEGVWVTLPVEKKHIFDQETGEGRDIMVPNIPLARAVWQMDDVKPDGTTSPLASAMIKEVIESVVPNKTQTPSQLS